MGEYVFACMQPSCASVHFDWGYFFLTSIEKEVTPHISKLLSEDKQ